MWNAAPGARVVSSGGVQALGLTLCTQAHISNSGSQKEFLVKTQEFGRRKVPDVS